MSRVYFFFQTDLNLVTQYFGAKIQNGEIQFEDEIPRDELNWHQHHLLVNLEA